MRSRRRSSATYHTMNPEKWVRSIIACNALIDARTYVIDSCAELASDRRAEVKIRLVRLEGATRRRRPVIQRLVKSASKRLHQRHASAPSSRSALFFCVAKERRKEAQLTTYGCVSRTMPWRSIKGNDHQPLSRGHTSEMDTHVCAGEVALPRGQTLEAIVQDDVRAVSDTSLRKKQVTQRSG